ncbi:hypothetical protein P256_02418 [Acinetobacter nectaris CIP 110549]|uniref:Uncharacterized protein n=1 Tax=Acinetobacter nectaris CIP 110549 TaxID=1392540 RepID=V2TH82_9GAMM|nr:hypothetical protein P256_02418 [Acinetobacter nectaris CIP 110549]
MGILKMNQHLILYTTDLNVFLKYNQNYHPI